MDYTSTGRCSARVTTGLHSEWFFLLSMTLLSNMDTQLSFAYNNIYNLLDTWCFFGYNNTYILILLTGVTFQAVR